MSTLTLKDGTLIYYKDWGPKAGPLVVFSHSWPLSSDSWESQMFFLASHGWRCIAHDRRGHGRSSQPREGNDMDTYADDLAQLFEALALEDATLIGHSAGGGEVARYIGRHGSKRVAKAILVSSPPPLLLQTSANPAGLPMEAFDNARQSYAADRAKFFLEAVLPYYGYNRPGAELSQGNIESFLRQGLMGGFSNLYEGIKAWSETDFTEDLKKFDVPALVIHGDDDQGVPFEVTGRLAAKLIPGAELIVYAGAPHGIPVTHKDRLNMDLLAFLKS